MRISKLYRKERTQHEDDYRTVHTVSIQWCAMHNAVHFDTRPGMRNAASQIALKVPYRNY